MTQAVDGKQAAERSGIALIGSFYDAPSMPQLYAAPCVKLALRPESGSQKGASAMVAKLTNRNVEFVCSIKR